MMKRLAVILGLATLSTPALATPITYTGAEFASLPGITFPTGTPTVMGDGLHFNIVEDTSVLAALPLNQFDLDVSDFEVQISITRLFRDDGFADHDPFIYLSDGLNLFGGQFFDRSNTTISTQARSDELSNDGQTLIFRDGFTESSAITVTTGSSYLATIGVQATAANTSISTDIDGIISSTGATSHLFDPSNGGPSLLFVSNTFGENFLINSITFTRGVSAPAAIAEPGALGGLAFGLTTLGFGLYRRRFI